MYNQFEAGSIKPQGWLRRQLEIQAEGLSGNLHKIWPDIRDSAWIGGNKEGWERVPYWLDGFIPLAYLLEDDEMIKTVDIYINAILDRQQKDGWICPCNRKARKDYDLWALFLIGKVLALYIDFTGSIRAKQGLYRAMKNCHKLLSEGKITVFNWARYRWYEAFIPLQLLYDEYKEKWIIELAKEIRRQGADYPGFVEMWKRPLNRWQWETHIVNLAMMFKYEAVSCCLLGEEYEGKAEKLWQILEKYNGTAVDFFTGDECLSGVANNQGTELCSITELMYSCELLYAVTGKEIWASRLERLSYNALPATISDDMWAHQYVQCVNQIACVRFPGKSFFRTNNEESHLFGLEPNYGCCTANFNQGWPKLAMNTFLKTKDGILASLMLPSELKTQINGIEVSIKNETEYPFRFFCRYTVKTDKPVRFKLKIRIPHWAKSLKINGKKVDKKKFVSFDKVWEGSEVITVELSDTPRLVSRPFGLKAAEYGPLVFSLPIEAEYRMHEYERDGVERKFPYCDYELFPRTEWRYGFASPKLEVVHNNGDEIPFSSKNPRVTLKALCSRVDWNYADGYDTVSAIKPNSAKPLSEPEEKELYPYGCAKLRITETVMVNKSSR